MVRLPVPVAVSCVSLVGALLAAPMTHVHDGDHVGDHDAGPVIHTHSHGHSSPEDQADSRPGSAALDDHDVESVRAIDLFQVFGGASVPTFDVPVAMATPIYSDVRVGAIRGVVQHAHGPPFARSLPSRAPPALS
jgi:hypothetical protein